MTLLSNESTMWDLLDLKNKICQRETGGAGRLATPEGRSEVGVGNFKNSQEICWVQYLRYRHISVLILLGLSACGKISLAAGQRTSALVRKSGGK